MCYKGHGQTQTWEEPDSPYGSRPEASLGSLAWYRPHLIPQTSQIQFLIVLHAQVWANLSVSGYSWLSSVRELKANNRATNKKEPLHWTSHRQGREQNVLLSTAMCFSENDRPW